MVKHNTDGMNPTGLTVEQAARLLGTKVEVIQRHISEGLPCREEAVKLRLQECRRCGQS